MRHLHQLFAVGGLNQLEYTVGVTCNEPLLRRVLALPDGAGTESRRIFFLFSPVSWVQHLDALTPRERVVRAHLKLDVAENAARQIAEEKKWTKKKEIL
jgi:hypothetical protein